VLSSGFAGFDELGGGFSPGRSYLLHGPLSAGKSTFALQFLLAGLAAREHVALVTRRAAPLVLEKAQAFGFDLAPWVRNGRLALLEYAPRVIESCTRLREDREIVDELRAELDRPRRRLVLDPATPLLAGTVAGGAAFRARTLAQELAALGLTTLLLCETPGDQEAVAAFRDLVYGSLRFEPATDEAAARIVPEQLPGARLDPVAFAIEPGLGLTPAAPRSATPGAVARTLLLVVRDAGLRERLQELLGTEHQVAVAADAVEGLARMSAAAPDLVLIEKETGSIDGADFCRKLRASGVNVPIVLLAERVRRVRDRVALLAAGADDCLEQPIDPRLLRLRVRALLSRYDGRRDRLAIRAAGDAAAPEAIPDSVITRSALEFVERVRREIDGGRQTGLSCSIVALRRAPGGSMGVLERLVREYDLVWLGDETVLVLLAETDESGTRVFLDRLSRSGAPLAVTAQRALDPKAADDTSLLSWVQEQLRTDARPALAKASNA
jgi:DNA-binding response OmpR family regulator/KaiC/GvpD/RAD55 family RecA-like ATPase